MKSTKEKLFSSLVHPCSHASVCNSEKQSEANYNFFFILSRNGIFRYMLQDIGVNAHVNLGIVHVFVGLPMWVQVHNIYAEISATIKMRAFCEIIFKLRHLFLRLEALNADTIWVVQILSAHTHTLNMQRMERKNEQRTLTHTQNKKINICIETKEQSCDMRNSRHKICGGKRLSFVVFVYIQYYELNPHLVFFWARTLSLEWIDFVTICRFFRSYFSLIFIIESHLRNLFFG